MNVLSLCTGILGFEWACQLVNDALGFEFYRPVGFSDIDPYCIEVERHYFPQVPQLGAIQNVSDELIRRGIIFDALIGGIPCQPYSEAGKRMGKNDARDLWPDTRAIISQWRPRWVCIENVAGFADSQDGLPRLIHDLENEGYSVGSVEIPACAVGASHERLRTFVLAHTERSERRTVTCSRQPDYQRPECKRSKKTGFTGICSTNGHSLANSIGQRVAFTGETRFADLSKDGGQTVSPCNCSDSGAKNLLFEPSMGFSFDELAASIVRKTIPVALNGEEQYPHEPPRLASKGKHWKQELSALGNAIFPAQAAMPLLALALAEIGEQ